MTDDSNFEIPAALINVEPPSAPVIYEDRIRISRSKFDSLFGWKTASDIIQQEQQGCDEEESGAECEGVSCRQQTADLIASNKNNNNNNNSSSENSTMPSCICEIMRENRVTVVPSFNRRGVNNAAITISDGNQSLLLSNADNANQQQQINKNKRDYMLRIFGESESDVAAAKFKIQSAVHQVAVMGSTATLSSSSDNVVDNNSNNGINQSQSLPGAIGSSVPRPLGSGSSTSLASNIESSNRSTNGQWWANVSDRLTLRVDVDYTVHSHLIGRNGGNIASVMRATQTHIHFPDSNKQSSSSANNRSGGGGGSGGSRSASPSLVAEGGNGFSSMPPAKNNYVTVSGPSVDQVEEARQYIRRMTPLRLAIPFSTLQVPLSLTGQVFVPARLAASSRRVMQEFCDRGLSAAMRSDSLVVSGTMSIADLVIQATMQICVEVYECLVPVSLSIDVTPRDWAFVRGPGDCYTRKIEHATGCQFLFPSQSLDDARNSSDGRRQPVRIVGFPANVVKARLLLQSRLPIQLSWPLRSQMSTLHESDAALKEIVASKYEIFLTLRDRSGRAQAGTSNQPAGRDSGSATPEMTIAAQSNNKTRPASSGAAAYHMIQPKHIVLKSFEGNLPNVYRFYAYMRDLSNQTASSKPSSRAGSRLDDMTSSTSLPTPPQSPSWWMPIPSDLSDDEMFQKVDALVHDGFLLAARASNATFGAAAAAPITSAANFSFLAGLTGNVQADPQVFYTAYALALAQQQQQQSATVLAALANGWAPNLMPHQIAIAAKTPLGIMGRGPGLVTTNASHLPLNTQQSISLAAASRAVLSQRNAEQASSGQQASFSPRSLDDGASSPESNSSASLENYNIVVDEKSSVNNHFRNNPPPAVPYSQQRSVSSMSSTRDILPEGRPITAASRVFGQHMSFDSGNSASKDAADRLLEQFAASLTKPGSSTDNNCQASQSAVIVSAESHKIYEVPRRCTTSTASTVLPSAADPIASGILSAVIASSENNNKTPPQSARAQQPQLNNLRIPSANGCGLLFSLSQPDSLLNLNVGTTASSFIDQKPSQHQAQVQSHKVLGLPNFGASSIVVGGDKTAYHHHTPDQLAAFMMGSIGAEFLASRASSTGGQGRSLSITGGFAPKLQTTELYYEQFADRIDERLGAVLTRAGVARSDIGKLASQEMKLESFLAMSDNDLRDCGIWQLGVRRQLLRLIEALNHGHSIKGDIAETPRLVVSSVIGDNNTEQAADFQTPDMTVSASSSCNNERPAAHSDPLPLSNNSKSLHHQQSEIEIPQSQQLLQPSSQQLPPQSPPFFASLKTYRLESEFRLL